ncbi:MAG: glycoside hydrolase family 3 N-terminal domain-containing protein [Chloroherpetonaceae bacterium]|nr:glycoside hydrolase family 3 N-terminal domain-containing protein [Chloroherpetonaceae bacterium]
MTFLLRSYKVFVTFLLIGFHFSSITFSQAKPEKRISKIDSLDFKIGQMLCVGFRGMYVDSAKEVIRDIQTYHLGSVILFDYDVERKISYRNISSPSQVKALLRGLDSITFLNTSLRLLKGIDQEGGKVNRLKMKYGFPFFPSAASLGNLSNRDSTKHYAALTAKSLMESGFNLNFAPVLDLNQNPDNPVIGKIERSFSGNPDTVILNASIFIDEAAQRGIHSVVKHFPGHGSSRNDSHLGVTDVSETWSDIELIPFAKLIEKNGSISVMTAHLFNRNWDTLYPATLSQSVVSGILRKKMNFKEVIFSDDLQMKAVTDQFGFEQTLYLAIEAGVDILVFGNNLVYDSNLVPKAHAAIKNMVTSGKVSKKRIDESFQRIARLKRTLKH